jgi:hypothetical protein
MIFDVIASRQRHGRVTCKLGWPLLALLFWLPPLGDVSQAADFVIESKRAGGTISLSAEIVPGDASKFRQAL